MNHKRDRYLGKKYSEKEAKCKSRNVIYSHHHVWVIKSYSMMQIYQKVITTFMENSWQSPNKLNILLKARKTMVFS